jgi:hypothetical protein
LGRLIEEKGIESVREKGVTTHSSGSLTSTHINIKHHSYLTNTPQATTPKPSPSPPKPTASQPTS